MKVAQIVFKEKSGSPSIIRGILAVISTVFICATANPQAQPALPKADAIYLHGNVYTGMAGASSFHEAERAQALAVRGERILAVGTEADIRKPIFGS